jgi:hypothetical protein
MLKNKATVEKVLNDRVYHLICDVDAPITDAKAVLDYFMNYMQQIEEAAIKQQKEAPQALPVAPAEPQTQEAA